jgi:hypothetical protein
MLSLNNSKINKSTLTMKKTALLPVLFVIFVLFSGFIIPKKQTKNENFLVHIVLIKLKSSVSKQDARFIRLQEKVKNLPTQLPQIQTWQVGKNILDKSINVDFGIVARFKNQADFDTYLNDKNHKVIIEQWLEIADFQVCNFYE